MDLQERFKGLVEEHYADVWRYASHLVGGRDVEDLVHDAFLAAFDRMVAGQEDIRDASKWLRGTLRHLAAGWWREQRRLPSATAEHLVELLETSDGRPGDSETVELQQALKKCVEELDARSGGLLGKRYTDGLSIAEIARGLGRRTETVRTWIFRIRQTLRACVERRMVAGSKP